MPVRQTDFSAQAVSSVRKRPGGRVWFELEQLKRGLGAAAAVCISRDVESAGRIYLGLERLGCSVRIVRLSVQAFQPLAAMGPRLCFIDADDNDRDAPGLLRQLRDQTPGPAALFVALINRESASRRRRLQQAGFDCVLSKPLDPHLFPQDLFRGIPSLCDRNSIPGQSR